MLQAVKLPAGISNLDTGLSYVDTDDFSHFFPSSSPPSPGFKRQRKRLKRLSLEPSKRRKQEQNRHKWPMHKEKAALHRNRNWKPKLRKGRGRKERVKAALLETRQDTKRRLPSMLLLASLPRRPHPCTRAATPARVTSLPLLSDVTPLSIPPCLRSAGGPPELGPPPLRWLPTGPSPPPASCDSARSSASAPMPPYLEKSRATLFVTLYLPPQIYAFSREVYPSSRYVIISLERE